MTQGLLDNLEQFNAHRIRYIPWVSTPLQSGAGLLEMLASESCAVITDLFPTYHPKHVLEQVKSRLSVQFVAIDGNAVFYHCPSENAPFQQPMHSAVTCTIILPITGD